LRLIINAFTTQKHCFCCAINILIKSNGFGYNYKQKAV
jgi:hypothetical protein